MHCSQHGQLVDFLDFVDIEPPQALFSSQHVQLKVDTTMTLSALVRQIQSAIVSYSASPLPSVVIGIPVCSCLFMLQALLCSQQQQERTAVIGIPVCSCLVMLKATLWSQQQQERTA